MRVVAIVAKAGQTRQDGAVLTAESLRKIAEVSDKFVYYEETGELVTSIELSEYEAKMMQND